MIWLDSKKFSRPQSVSSIRAIYINGNTSEGFDIAPAYTPVDPDATLPWCSWNAPGTGWTTITLDIPADAKAMAVGGLLVITHGTQPENADLRLGFRDVSDTVNRPYIGQAGCQDPVPGVRIPFFAIVPVNQKKFQFKWACIDSSSSNPRLITPGAWPHRSSYAINLSVQGVWR